MNINKRICTIISLTIALNLIALVVFIIVLGCSGEHEPVSKSISMVGDYFGGITTLAAACIAAQLFNDWRVQHNKEITNVFRLRVLEQFELFCEAISAFRLASSELESNLSTYIFAEELDIVVDGLVPFETAKGKILQKIQSIEINYDDLCRKLKMYGRISNTLDTIDKHINHYQDKLSLISDNTLKNLDIIPFINSTSTLEIGYIELQNMIDETDCLEIIRSLKVKYTPKNTSDS